MLYPDFKELLDIGNKTKNIGLSSSRKVRSVVSGDQNSPFRGRGLEFEEVREYVHGDDVRNIDWRVTARTGIPHLKLFTEDRERSVIICTDVNTSMRFGTRETFKSIQAARAAAMLGWISLSEHNRTGASFYGNVPDGMRFFGPHKSRRSLWRMFKQLSDKEDHYPETVLLEDHLQYLSKALPSGALVFIISDFINLTPGLKKSLASVHRRGDVVLISVNDPADQSLPKAGTLTFMEGKDKLIVNTSDRGRASTYEREWEDNRKTLDDLVKSLGLGFIKLKTNSDVVRDLALGLKKQRRKARAVI